FEENSARKGGGAWAYAGDANEGVFRCRFIANQADEGGGLFLGESSGSGPYALTECSFTGNVADLGAALRFDSQWSPLTVRDCSFLDNGVQAGQDLFVSDCILRGTFTLEAASLTVSYCDVEGGWPGPGNFDADPQFVEPSVGDLHLQPSSPC